MTANWLIYALGGGHGHGVRGDILRRTLVELGEKVTMVTTPRAHGLLARAGDDIAGIHAAENLESMRQRILDREFSHLVVDTFAEGWNQELPELLAYFEHRLLIRRYRSDEVDESAYDQILSPYCETSDEWEEPFRRGSYTGLLVRPNGLHFEQGDEWDLIILNPSRINSPRLSKLFSKRSGLRIKQTRRYEGERARKFLCIGAGYNSVYEGLRCDADVCFVPLPRHYDNQRHRVELRGVGICSEPEFEAWLERPYERRPTNFKAPSLRLQLKGVA